MPPAWAWSFSKAPSAWLRDNSQSETHSGCFQPPGIPQLLGSPVKLGGDSNSFPQGGEMEGGQPLQSAGSIRRAWLEAGGFAGPRCDCCWISKEEKNLH